MKFIEPGKISGTIVAPASKSHMQRLAAAFALSDGLSVISNPSRCQDAQDALQCAQALGARVNLGDDQVEIEGNAQEARLEMDCGESGLCMRLFAPIAALSGKKTKLAGQGTLNRRSMLQMGQPFQDLGVQFTSAKGFPPISVKGPLQGGSVNLDGSAGSQFLSGLLTALPLAKRDSVIRANSLNSKPYVSLTLQVLEKSGIRVHSDLEQGLFRIPGSQAYQTQRVRVEGDWSAAAFLLVAGALRGRIEVRELNLDSLQPDKAVLDALKSAGAPVKAGASAVTVGQAELHAFSFDATHCPDLFPPLAVLATGCQGLTRLRGVHRLAGKESNRALALQAELGALGAKISIRGDVMEIKGSMLAGGNAQSHDDHRIAMAVAIAALNCRQGVQLRGGDCVGKSYPSFFQDLQSVRG